LQNGVKAFLKKKTFDVQFVPGQGQDQKSQHKLFCPETSRDKITFPKKTKKQEKDIVKQEKHVLKQ
jgi:hypothetical protein